MRVNYFFLTQNSAKKAHIVHIINLKIDTVITYFSQFWCEIIATDLCFWDIKDI